MRGFASYFIVLGVVFVVGCGAGGDGIPREDADGEQVSRRSRPILGGTEATAFPEAVLVDLKWNGEVIGICSGALVAPKVVLTAGHCVVGANGWRVRAPFASDQVADSSAGATYDYTSDGETVPFDQHDVGLVFLDAPIALPAYPTLDARGLPDGSQLVNIGRLRDGQASDSTLYVSAVLTIESAARAGYPYAYLAEETIQPGDSGGPAIIPATHMIAAVNSGAGGGIEVLARVDLVEGWIQQQIGSHGGSGSTSTAGEGGGDTCAHDVCSSGAKLSPTCDPCVQQICAADGFCCSGTWDTFCVAGVKTICGKTTCGGDTGGPASCDDLTFVGKCTGNSVEWCDAGGPQALDCGAKQCGFDDEEGYYTCI
jgi:hypothetical protein